MNRYERLTIGILAGWLFLTVTFVFVITFRNPIMRAVISMGLGLIILWIFVGGTLMFRFREPVRKAVQHLRIDWRIKFILFATLLALTEEAITTTMTNLAPVFGVKIGQAYITASANYIDVVTMHSVIVFIPMFVGWAVMLSRYAFTPFQVFLLFGLTGTIAETLFSGPQALMEFAMWIFVYGLMVYLPAYCVPEVRNARPVRWWLFPLAVVLPFLFLILVPTAAIPHLIDPHHPNIHFPPIHP